ncbi:MAG: hypothetical protein GEV11_11315 [Streptosporangiales bacterium]|nr:hypothetical protein [Streptosporangiales bacterium]
MGQFTCFHHRLGKPERTGKGALDFGSNVGNVLLDRNCAIEPSDYWCIEVSRDAVTEARRRHPDAHFVFSDRYSMNRLHPNAEIRPPVEPERHHCAILDARTGTGRR